ncbi:uncharacterized protein [Vicugna pacos]|uniref:Uncharacterized protein n=1 Tax=Vicugna pacos TaxID=30538 RepID=A0ABM5C8U3_VICPA
MSALASSPATTSSPSPTPPEEEGLSSETSEPLLLRRACFWGSRSLQKAEEANFSSPGWKRRSCHCRREAWTHLRLCPALTMRPLPQAARWGPCTGPVSAMTLPSSKPCWTMESPQRRPPRWTAIGGPCASGESSDQLLRGPGPGAPGPAGTNRNAWLPSSWQLRRTGALKVKRLAQGHQLLLTSSQATREERGPRGLLGLYRPESASPLASQLLQPSS